MKKHTKIITLLLAVLTILLFIGYFIFKTEYGYFLKFWGALLCIGVLFYPLTSFVLSKFHDGGWVFSKIIGLALSSWVMWLLSSMKIFRFSVVNCYIVLTVLAIVNFGVLVYKNEKRIKKLQNANRFDIYKASAIKFLKSEKLKNILITEIIFVIVLFTWTYINGYSPEIDDRTEKYMDYGYMNSIMNSEYMPPEDIWMSGEDINYYYYGQYVSGFLCKVAGVEVNAGYNLMISLVATLTFVMPYVIAYNLFRNPGFKKKIMNRGIPILLALLTGFSMSAGGTFHYTNYRLLNNGESSYYYYDQVRFIGYKPETNDQTATEIPVCMSIAGDLHAHYTDIIFGLTSLALLLQYFLKRKNDELESNLKNPIIILLGFILGIQKMTNFWDYPIYLVIISVTIAVKYIIQNKFNIKSIGSILLIILEIFLIQQLVAFPFTSGFHISATEVHFVHATTPVYKWLILWGLPTCCSLVFLVLFIERFFRGKKKIEFFKYLQLNSRSVYALILAVCAFGLAIIPEIVYVRDIYTEPFERFNTMNKLTPEAYVLFCISVNYFIMKILMDRRIKMQVCGLLLMIVNVSTFGYGIDALEQIYHNSEYVGISDSEKYLREKLPADYVAIQWIKDNISNNAVMLEATEYGSYSMCPRVSIFVGNPTLMGWSDHEWIWRANADYSRPQGIINRINDTKKIYTSPNDAKELIKKYNISYIMIGEMEYATYKDIDVEGILGLGDVVYEGENGINPIYIVDVSTII